MVPDPNFMLACMQGAWDELLAAADALAGQKQAIGKAKKKLPRKRPASRKTKSKAAPRRSAKK